MIIHIHILKKKKNKIKIIQLINLLSINKLSPPLILQKQKEQKKKKTYDLQSLHHSPHQDSHFDNNLQLNIIPIKKNEEKKGKEVPDLITYHTKKFTFVICLLKKKEENLPFESSSP